MSMHGADVGLCLTGIVPVAYFGFFHTVGRTSCMEKGMRKAVMMESAHERLTHPRQLLLNDA